MSNSKGVFRLKKKMNTSSSPRAFRFNSEIGLATENVHLFPGLTIYFDGSQDIEDIMML